ncbi:hypothetical protein [uncultured Campylobacter sp.]|uniref:hypothetical protein n=1 Tax=uncultured Campylobacter sp. TaxID=218934 RepID=UPI00261FC702|nr:hypothetical protein [uncultured Campylobacter sp.]
MKNKAALKFKNFTACAHSSWIRTKLARAGAALGCARPAEAICLERSSADAKPSGVGKNFKSLNFKSRNTTGADFDADRDIRLSAYRDINFNAYHDINSGRDRAANFKISNANLKADLARPKASFR